MGLIVNDEDDIERLLRTTKTIAMVGASERPHRPSHGVMRFLQARGYRVIPVNPTSPDNVINDEPVVAQLSEITEPVDMVDIFHRSHLAGEDIDAAIAEKDRLAIKSVWLQLGVIDEAAASRAEAAGLEVVMDRCPAIEYPKLIS